MIFLGYNHENVYSSSFHFKFLLIYIFHPKVSDVYNRVQGPYCPKPENTHHPNLAQDNKRKSKTAAYFYSLRKYYERDSAYLGLIEAFIQDGPQLILQLYILAIRDAQPHQTVPVVGT